MRRLSLITFAAFAVEASVATSGAPRRVSRATHLAADVVVGMGSSSTGATEADEPGAILRNSVEGQADPVHAEELRRPGADTPPRGVSGSGRIGKPGSV